MLAQRLASFPPGQWVRAAIDGPPAARPPDLAARLAQEMPARGRPALHVSTDKFLRPASVRLEQGRTNPDSYYEGWVDAGGLRREVLDPLAPGGTGRVLPSLWDPVTDRATRADYVSLAPGGVLLVSGDLLLGGELPFDLTVHFELSPAALARRTPSELAWTLPAYERYADEVNPASFADIVIRANDPAHLALVEASEMHPR